MSRLATRLVAVLAPIALLVPAAAHAKQVTVDDAVADAKAINMAVAFGELFDGSTTEAPFFLDAPAETSTDVVRTTIDHARKRLTLTVQFRDLVATNGRSVDFRIITPAGRYALGVRDVAGRTFSDLYPLGRPDDSVVVVSDDGSITITATDEPKPCRTVRARFDMVADTLTASAPTSCLGSPKWVQVSAAVSRTQVTGQPDGSANIAGYADDAFRGGLSVKSLGRSQKVRRG